MFGKKKLADVGREAPAEVLEADRSRWVLTRGDPAVVDNTEIRWTLRLRVAPADEPPFEAKLHAFLPQLMSPHAGMTLAVRYDPADHSRVELDMSEAAQVDAAITGMLDSDPSLRSATVAGIPFEEVMRDAVRDPEGFRQRMERIAAESSASGSAAMPGQPAVVFGSASVHALGVQAAPTASTSGRGAIPPDDRLVQLERLASLRDRGVLSDEEFEAEKRRILGAE